MKAIFSVVIALTGQFYGIGVVGKGDDKDDDLEGKGGKEERTGR